MICILCSIGGGQGVISPLRRGLGLLDPEAFFGKGPAMQTPSNMNSDFNEPEPIDMGEWLTPPPAGADTISSAAPTLPPPPAPSGPVACSSLLNELGKFAANRGQ